MLWLTQLRHVSVQNELNHTQKKAEPMRLCHLIDFYTDIVHGFDTIKYFAILL